MKALSKVSIQSKNYRAVSRLVTLIWTAASAVFSGWEAKAEVAEEIHVSGWPLPAFDGLEPPFKIGNDPVIGRLACPPLSLVNLTSLRSEPLLIRQAVEVSRGVWRFEMRSGIYWWNGQEVTTSDLALFIERELGKTVASKAGKLWEVPPFKVQLEGASTVLVQWQKPPVFGPYIFNGLAFWRALDKSAQHGSAFSYECAGTYKPEARPFGLTLAPNPGYKYSRPPINFYQVAAVPKQQGRKISFRFANSFDGNPGSRLSDDQAVCSMKIDLPLVSLIHWNTAEAPMNDPRMRILLTNLTPRGELLRAGAAYLGELVSGPIPRNHPGYDNRILVRPFDIEAASKELDDLGYRREKADRPRIGKDGKPLKLKIATDKASSGLVEKVLSDVLLAVGIGVQFEPINAGASPKGFQGMLMGAELGWPHLDFLTNFHSGERALGSYPAWFIADSQMDRHLEAYAVSLTTENPNFTILEKIHQRFFELEPATVLMQHKACIDFSGGREPPSRSLAITDPDWFRKLVL